MSAARSLRWSRVRAGWHTNSRNDIRKAGSFWYIVGEPYTAYLTLRDAKQEVESRG